ncbi:UDP-N-acetylglucosamine 1-carboxyvinyltransferase, partial [Streptococcus suis]
TGSKNGLKGPVEIEGATNAVLPLVAATVLASQGQTKLTQVPILSDVYTMHNVVRGLGVRGKCDEDTKTIESDAPG